MHPDQAEYDPTLVLDLRTRLQDVTSLLRAVVTAGDVGADARNSLGVAIRSLEAARADLAAVLRKQPGEPDLSLQESREFEARSEVDSGEFDMHG